MSSRGGLRSIRQTRGGSICVTWPQAEELHDLGLSEPVALDKGLDTEKKFEFLVRQNNVGYD
jgi:hypothetical protein